MRVCLAGDRAGPFGCPFFAELDQPFTIKFSDAQMTQAFIEKGQAGIL